MTGRGEVSFQVPRMFRHVQLLSNLCNEIQQKLMMIPIISSTIIVSSFSLATLAHIHFSADNLIIAGILVLAVMDATLVSLFCLGGMVLVNKKSKVLIHKFKSYRHHSELEMEKLWIRKFAKTCMPIRMKFGSSNFVESLTPLKCLNCAARLTIQILLTERRHGGQ